MAPASSFVSDGEACGSGGGAPTLLVVAPSMPTRTRDFGQYDLGEVTHEFVLSLRVGLVLLGQEVSLLASAVHLFEKLDLLQAALLELVERALLSGDNLRVSFATLGGQFHDVAHERLVMAQLLQRDERGGLGKSTRVLSELLHVGALASASLPPIRYGYFARSC